MPGMVMTAGRWLGGLVKRGNFGMGGGRGGSSMKLMLEVDWVASGVIKIEDVVADCFRDEDVW